ncbi:hypothetical protein [Methylorubrum extorquens]|jgi:hypothetical protein|uniref:hypothetical protein n=1 Tax=Methylorubrum extorquens TaxID=408 RepID=UPI0022370AB4|nr:hypothetical protein [Methylorubrum extorquens]UYW28431.1 hypothetical protein OKC48_07925 [Methylorubrum extorquens]UYW31855.1 hypothetical protein OKB92_23255 [Methylorubrum extorquens]
MALAFDRTRLVQAFELLGADLSARGLFVELAVYGGGAALHDLYASVYDEAPPDEASLRFRSVLQDGPR